MNGIMLQAVLLMPPELWDGSKIDTMQRHQRYLQAANRIHELECAIKESMMHLETNYDIDGDSMEKSDAYITLKECLET